MLFRGCETDINDGCFWPPCDPSLVNWKSCSWSLSPFLKESRKKDFFVKLVSYDEKSGIIMFHITSCYWVYKLSVCEYHTKCGFFSSSFCFTSMLNLTVLLYHHLRTSWKHCRAWSSSLMEDIQCKSKFYTDTHTGAHELICAHMHSPTTLL